jgi:hypothetical protein
VTLHPQPDRECPKCGAGNRSLKHVETKHREVTGTSPEPEYLLLAIYHCETCDGIDVVPFDRRSKDRKAP